MKFYVLGPLEVVSSGGPVAIRGRRLRALLAILLLHATQVVSIERLIDEMWPENPPQSAVENIRTYICQLRSLLRLPYEQGSLESHPGGYRLMADPEHLDLLRFSRLADAGRRTLQKGANASAIILLGEAMSLWRGSPLLELDLGPITRAKTVALEEQRWQIQMGWLTARLALGDHAEVTARLRELIGERPLDETLWSYLVTSLHAQGRTGEALSAVAEARAIFVNELGIEPGPQLRRVQDVVLRGELLPG